MKLRSNLMLDDDAPTTTSKEQTALEKKIAALYQASASVCLIADRCVKLAKQLEVAVSGLTCMLGPCLCVLHVQYVKAYELTRMCTDTRARACTCACTRAHTHTHTHIHTHNASAFILTHTTHACIL